jgi:hypothetical protein
VRAALSARADGGKGEAVYQFKSLLGWDDCTEEEYKAFTGFRKRILYTAPQAECAPREAQPVAVKAAIPEGDYDLDWIKACAPTPERTPREAQPIYQIEDEGAWMDVSALAFTSKLIGKRRKRIVYAAPQAECAPQQTDAEALYEAWQNTLKHMDAQAECAPLCEHKWEAMTEPHKECVKCGDVRLAECAPREAQPVLPIWWSDFITNICDIPGRTSPEGEPEAIIATIDELRHCALASIEAIEDAPASDTAEAAALRAFDKSKLDGYSHDLESYCAGYIDAAPTPERADAEKDAARWRYAQKHWLNEQAGEMADAAIAGEKK